MYLNLISEKGKAVLLMERGLWQSVIGEIELSVPSSSFEALFKKAELTKLDGSNVEITVPNVFIQAQLEGRYKDLIPKILEKNGVEQPAINYKVNLQAKRKPVNREEVCPPVATSLSTTTTSVVNNTSNTSQLVSGLNPRYQFENFIVGSSNDFAYSACQAVANNPGSKYNPLFLYSGVGLGKTHLMQAVGNQIIKNNPQTRVMYITSETFIQEFLDSIRFKKQDFSSRYRNVDVLIVDDMQFIAGKEKTQEEFFHTFNDLHQNNKQIIISSDRPPKEIPTLTERLRSRFEWGMSIDIQMPDFETRCAIIEAKADQSQSKLNSEVTQFLADIFRTNVRELEGSLNQLLAYSEMRSIPADIELAKALFLDKKSTRPKHLTSKQIITKTARQFQIEIDQICGSCRSKHIVVPRQIAMYLLRSELHMSFPKIATELGRKDHTTAIHSVEKIEKEIKIDPILREQVNAIRGVLYE